MHIWFFASYELFLNNNRYTFGNIITYAKAVRLLLITSDLSLPVEIIRNQLASLDTQINQGLRARSLPVFISSVYPAN